MNLPEPENIPEGHAFAAKHGNGLDVFLRFHGFRIRSRPEGEEPLWEKDGCIYAQSHAVEICHQEQENGKGGCAAGSNTKGGKSSTKLKGGL